MHDKKTDLGRIPLLFRDVMVLLLILFNDAIKRLRTTASCLKSLKFDIKHALLMLTLSFGVWNPVYAAAGLPPDALPLKVKLLPDTRHNSLTPFIYNDPTSVEVVSDVEHGLLLPQVSSFFYMQD